MKLRAKAEILNDFGLDWWTAELLPVLDQFVAAASGSPDVKFWKSVCNLHGLSGMWDGFVTGWVQTFFPYRMDGSKNYAINGWRKNYEEGTGDVTNETRESDFHYGCSAAGPGTKLNELPRGLSQAPFKGEDVPNGRTYSMTFNGGLVAIAQSRTTRALMPVSGWAVLDHGLMT